VDQAAVAADSVEYKPAQQVHRVKVTLAETLNQTWRVVAAVAVLQVQEPLETIHPAAQVETVEQVQLHQLPEHP
jgi:hypothetical protein